MALWPKLLLSGGTLLLAALTAIAIYAYTQIRFLSLPISDALGLFTILFPLLTGVSLRGVTGLINRSSEQRNYRLTIPLVVVIGFQLVYETVIATLAMTHVLPSTLLTCGLDKQWLQLFRQKDERAIRAIQDRFNCCGLNTLVDRAFPFDSNRGPSRCPQVFNRNLRCLEPWQRAEQMSAGLILLVASSVFIIKVLSLLSLLTGPGSWQQHRAYDLFRHHDDNRVSQEEDAEAHLHRLLEDGAERDGYRDEPAPSSGPLLADRAMQAETHDETRETTTTNVEDRH